ncbi:endodeoxyribonuclease RusA [Chromobacterium sp. LK1]|uniref:RusA family crossover junction endodeoxyribonuclease n=1 Tax=Chromobacterium sp. LK1 TaxID=1628193 RepID=UPI000654796B|nr:RusA family crossover junction endodeoxyribonuclease [Chromobacterium sp. LK1]KMN32070.1 endodeoxyribonuclease RusA [Chromobacterium sp. LK1]
MTVRQITLILPYPISANRYWRSFVPRGQKRAVVVVSEEAKAYKSAVQMIAYRAGVIRPIGGRVQVDIQLFAKRPQDWARRAAKDPEGWWDSVQCIDLDNARKVLNDALKGIAFGDDKLIKRDSGEVMEPDGPARVVVTITQMAKPQTQGALFAA